MDKTRSEIVLQIRHRDRGDYDPAVPDIRTIALSRWAIGAMSDRILIIKHEAVPACGSFEMRFPDDQPSQ